eukprot:m.99581 g.99581  ORF g.99581 m.99581 type:complete len:460 (-) comp13146_c0_seq4:1273-2652(-)
MSTPATALQLGEHPVDSTMCVEGDGTSLADGTDSDVELTPEKGVAKERVMPQAAQQHRRQVLRVCNVVSRFHALRRGLKCTTRHLPIHPFTMAKHLAVHPKNTLLVDSPAIKARFARGWEGSKLAVAIDGWGHLSLIPTECHTLSAFDSFEVDDSPPQTAFDFAWVPQHPTIIVAGNNPGCRLHRLNRMDAPLDFTYQLGPRQSCTSVECHPSNQYVFAAGCRGGTVNIWDTRACGGTTRKPSGGIVYSKPAHTIMIDAVSLKRKANRELLRSRSNPTSVTAIQFADDSTLFSGTDSGMVHLWDLRRTYSVSQRTHQPIRQLHHPQPVSSSAGVANMRVHAGRRLLAVACANGHTFLHGNWEDPSQAYSMVLPGRTTRSFFASLDMNDDASLLAASYNSSIMLWNLDCPSQEPHQIDMGEDTVLSLDFKPSRLPVLMASDAAGVINLLTVKGCTLEASA